jgi:hypothetical protein
MFDSSVAALSESQFDWIFGKIARRGSGEMSDDLYTLISYRVEATADWRRRQAEYFPHDDRNARAAKELERLAAEVDQLEGSSVHEQIRLATDRLKNEDWFAVSKSVYAELRSVGFDSTYENGLRSWNGIAIGCGEDAPRCLRKLGLCSGSGNAQLAVKNLAGYGPAACAFQLVHS